MLMSVLFRWFSRSTFHFMLVFSFDFWREDLLAAIHASGLVDMMRETQVARFFILKDIYRFERVMRPAVPGMTARMAHAD